MKSLNKTLSICALLMTGAACEQGWSVDGEVVVGAELRRDRPLRVVMFDLAPDQIAAGGGAPSWPGTVVLEKDEIPPSPVTFRYGELGCVGSKALFIAWAPAAAAAVVDPEGWRAPGAGDYYASSGWIDKDPCGWSGTQYVQLTLGVQ